MTMLLHQRILITWKRWSGPNLKKKKKSPYVPTHHWIIHKIRCMNILSTDEFHLVFYKCKPLSLLETAAISSWQLGGTSSRNKHWINIVEFITIWSWASWKVEHWQGWCLVKKTLTFVVLTFSFNFLLALKNMHNS